MVLEIQSKFCYLKPTPRLSKTDLDASGDWWVGFLKSFLALKALNARRLLVSSLVGSGEMKFVSS